MSQRHPVSPFKDDVLARHRPEWAVGDSRAGGLWLDAERLAWLDPFREEAWAHPIVAAAETVRRARERTARGAVDVRPWIQDFRDYAFDRRVFGVSELRAQMRAASDAGATGWMLWNPQNRYTIEALAPWPAARP